MFQLSEFVPAASRKRRPFRNVRLGRFAACAEREKTETIKRSSRFRRGAVHSRYPRRREMFRPTSMILSFSSCKRCSVMRMVGPDTLTAAATLPL